MDAEYFDIQGFVRRRMEDKDGGELAEEDQLDEFPGPGQRVMLASFEVKPQYCGVLTNFSQFTDGFARDCGEVLTPGLRWEICRNGMPISPYHDIEQIINPWGYGGFPFMIRLDENSTVEIGIRNCITDDRFATWKEYNLIGARLVGRYWYNKDYGE